MWLIDSLVKKFGEDSLSIRENQQSLIEIKTEILTELIQFLRTDSNCYFDYLSCITGIDNEEKEVIEVVYSLYSIPFNKHIDIKIEVNNPGNTKLSEAVPSISGIHRSANWMEREVYDMFGIPFSNHPDLSRILMPADWIGYPLRKNYETSEKYHGITIDYQDES